MCQLARALLALALLAAPHDVLDQVPPKTVVRPRQPHQMMTDVTVMGGTSSTPRRWLQSSGGGGAACQHGPLVLQAAGNSSKKLLDFTGGGYQQNNMDCSWRLECAGGPAQQAVLLRFTAFDTESNFDFVSLADGGSGGTAITPGDRGLSGHQLPPQTFGARSGTLAVAFHSDGSNTADGFAAEYWCGEYIEGCRNPTASNYDPRATVGGSCTFAACQHGPLVLQAAGNSSKKLLDFTGGGYQQNNMDCSWRLECAGGPAQQAVLLRFTAFDTESNFDFVSLADGGSGGTAITPGDRGLSGHQLPPQTFGARSGTLAVAFHSDGRNNALHRLTHYTGFAAEYWCGCPNPGRIWGVGTSSGVATAVLTAFSFVSYHKKRLGRAQPEAAAKSKRGKAAGLLAMGLLGGGGLTFAVLRFLPGTVFGPALLALLLVSGLAAWMAAVRCGLVCCLHMRTGPRALTVARRLHRGLLLSVLDGVSCCIAVAVVSYLVGISLSATTYALYGDRLNLPAYLGVVLCTLAHLLTSELISRVWRVPSLVPNEQTLASLSAHVPRPRLSELISRVWRVPSLVQNEQTLASLSAHVPRPRLFLWAFDWMTVMSAVAFLDPIHDKRNEFLPHQHRAAARRIRTDFRRRCSCAESDFHRAQRACLRHLRNIGSACGDGETSSSGSDWTLDNWCHEDRIHQMRHDRSAS
eukprot:SAG22_NODE_49_length_24620_cov_80.053587_25_plen_693_part_00